MFRCLDFGILGFWDFGIFGIFGIWIFRFEILDLKFEI
jgi:hypothetical protein